MACQTYLRAAEALYCSGYADKAMACFNTSLAKCNSGTKDETIIEHINDVKRSLRLTPWTRLPAELLVDVISFLELPAAVRSTMVCKSWHQVLTHSRAIYRRLVLPRTLKIWRYHPVRFHEIVTSLVERSNHSLTHIDLEETKTPSHWADTEFRLLFQELRACLQRSGPTITSLRIHFNASTPEPLMMLIPNNNFPKLRHLEIYADGDSEHYPSFPPISPTFNQSRIRLRSLIIGPRGWVDLEFDDFLLDMLSEAETVHLGSLGIPLSWLSSMLRRTTKTLRSLQVRIDWVDEPGRPQHAARIEEALSGFVLPHLEELQFPRAAATPMKALLRAAPSLRVLRCDEFLSQEGYLGFSSLLLHCPLLEKLELKWVVSSASSFDGINSALQVNYSVARALTPGSADTKALLGTTSDGVLCPRLRSIRFAKDTQEPGSAIVGMVAARLRASSSALPPKMDAKPASSVETGLVKASESLLQSPSDGRQAAHSLARPDDDDETHEPSSNSSASSCSAIEELDVSYLEGMVGGKIVWLRDHVPTFRWYVPSSRSKANGKKVRGGW